MGKGSKNERRKNEKFPEILSPVKYIIMKMVFSEKHAMCIAMVETLQDMASSIHAHQNGLIFCLTKYKGPTHHDVQACICIEGSSMIQVIVNLSEWKETLWVERLMISWTHYLSMNS